MARRGFRRITIAELKAIIKEEKEKINENLTSCMTSAERTPNWNPGKDEKWTQEELKKNCGNSTNEC